MENTDCKELYLQRKAQQLMQWDKVVDKLKTREAGAVMKFKTDLQHHILKIQVIKARTEAKLRNLRIADKSDWDASRQEMEKSWLRLRLAFSRAATQSRRKNR
jgi:hypothetical protein